MINPGSLAGRTLFITGASRGIGKAIALRAAKDGANIVIAAKTVDPHPKLPGTIFTACEEVEKAGGKGLPCIVDVRSEQQVQDAVESAAKVFGGIDILVNNASAISLTGTLATDVKRFDLMHNINVRGTFIVSKACLPYLMRSKNPHILNLSPPLNMKPHWFQNHVAYTIAKYGMSMCVLGMAEEFREEGVAVNALWPKTAILTSAMEMLGGKGIIKQCRTPEIVADAAHAILTKDSKRFTGNFCIDEDVLLDAGITDFSPYLADPEGCEEALMADFFLDVHPDDVKEYLKASRGEGKSRADGEAQPATEPKPAKVPSGDGPAGGLGKVGRIFEVIRQNINDDLVNKVQASYLFIVKGQEAGTWYLDLKNGKGAAGLGESPTPPDATLTMDTKDFFDMFTGKLKPAGAFMTGKLKITGNLQKALKLEKLMGHLKNKL